MQTNRITRHINRLLLDPNNYRFIDKPDYKFVPDEFIDDPRIQQRTIAFLSGKNNENISDLIISFKTNGFLDMDQIQVKKLKEDYVVLEGNRRITTLKFLYDQLQNGNDVGVLTESDFKSINIIEIADEDPVQHLITMGLHHISGKKRWSAVNEAQLINDLVFKHHRTEDEVCNALAISKYVLRRSLRTLALIQQYKESDFGDQFETPMYSIFQSAIGNPTMKSWLGWNDDQYEAYNSTNLKRFFSWISRLEEIEESETGEERNVIKEPIITQYRQIREVSEFLGDEKALKRMEDSRSLAEGYSFSNAIGVAKLREAIGQIKDSARIAFTFNEYLTTSDYEEINGVKLKLDALIPSSHANILINEKRSAKIFPTVVTHFTQLDIGRYRKLMDVSVTNLKRVNIFVGGNNSGKTSMLEAFFLISQLNDINTYFDLEKYRGKFSNEFHSIWVDKNFISPIDLSGSFNSVNVSLDISSIQTKEDVERSGYLSTIYSQASLGTGDLTSSINLYSNKEPEFRYESSKVLCRAAFTSPYRYNSKLLQTAHTMAVREGFFDKVKTFLIEKFDPNIRNIELVSEAGENRFMILTSESDKAIDLTKYGEGFQRVFEIAVLIGYCRDGILCIDEIDSAIHKSVLRDFTKFVQSIAREFNVQIFVSTHSKECIDAFVGNEFDNSQVNAYALSFVEGRTVCKYIEGTRLEMLIDSLNFDIR